MNISNIGKLNEKKSVARPLIKFWVKYLSRRVQDTRIKKFNFSFSSSYFSSSLFFLHSMNRHRFIKVQVRFLVDVPAHSPVTHILLGHGSPS